jgi:hypothetical protein
MVACGATGAGCGDAAVVGLAVEGGSITGVATGAACGVPASSAGNVTGVAEGSITRGVAGSPVGSGVAEGSAAVSPVAGAGVPFPVAAGIPHAARTRIRALINTSARIDHSIVRAVEKGSISTHSNDNDPLFVPRVPLLPSWGQGVGGMRGKSPSECRKPRIAPRNSTLESARVRRRPRTTWERGRLAHVQPYRGRFLGKPLRVISRFRQQDAQTHPSSRVGAGGRGDEGQKPTGMPQTAHRSQELDP